MSDLKFVIVGGGSTGWTPRLATDYFLSPEIDGSKLVLVDIDRDAALLIQRYLQMAIEKIGCKWTVDVADLDAALDRADGVCVSISTGGYEAMQHDYSIPEKFGIYHCVGDTVGPAGISRTLRNVPVFVDIARRMALARSRYRNVRVFWLTPCWMSQSTRRVTPALQYFTTD